MKLICLLLLLGLPGTAAKVEDSTVPDSPAQTKSRFAMLDDVRLLANGLLQLGQSLREFVHKTKGQINDIFQKLNVFDSSFDQLSVITSEIKEEKEELKKTTTFLKTTNDEIKNLSQEINSKIDNILMDRNQLQIKVGSLEEKLSGLSSNLIPAEQLNEITALKEVIEIQEKSIRNLLKAVNEQQYQLSYQNEKIKRLEEKVNYDTFQETAQKLEDVNPRESNRTVYLTNNATVNSEDTNDLPVDCSEVFNRGQRNSGVYPINPNQSEPFNVYCEMTEDGPFTVIQRRHDGSVDFDQTWEKFRNGFGDLEGEFWLGLEKIYSIASQRGSVLKIQLEDWGGEKHFIQYNFTLEGPSSHYTIHLTKVSGDLLNAMASNDGMKFSTKDRDNDNDDSSCASKYTGGWWFNACGDVNLNGKYVWVTPQGHTEQPSRVYWKNNRGNSLSLKSTKISIGHEPNVGSFP